MSGWVFFVSLPSKVVSRLFPALSTLLHNPYIPTYPPLEVVTYLFNRAMTFLRRPQVGLEAAKGGPVRLVRPFYLRIYPCNPWSMAC